MTTDDTLTTSTKGNSNGEKRPIYGEVLSFSLEIDGVSVLDPLPEPASGVIVKNSGLLMVGWAEPPDLTYASLA